MINFFHTQKKKKKIMGKVDIHNKYYQERN